MASTTIRSLIALTFLAILSCRGTQAQFNLDDKDEATAQASSAPSPQPARPKSTIRKEKIRVVLDNQCSFTVWPAVYPGLRSLMESLKVKLEPGQKTEVAIKPWDLDIYIWGRTACSFNTTPRTGSPSGCLTGNCGFGYFFQCHFGALEGPAVSTVLFRKLQYGVDIASGFNLPISVRPNSRESEEDGKKKNECREMGCSFSPREWCPEEMQVRHNGTAAVCAPPRNDRNSLEEYFRLVRKHCPCIYPVVQPGVISPKDIPLGYTLTYCPQKPSS